MLTLGWSDGHTFLPLERSSGYKRRKEALLSAPHLVSELLNRAIASGGPATYVLVDNWFTHAPLIGRVVQRGLHVIGMVKNDNKLYLFMASRSISMVFTDLLHKCKGSNGLFCVRFIRNCSWDSSRRGLCSPSLQEKRVARDSIDGSHTDGTGNHSNLRFTLGYR